MGPHKVRGMSGVQERAQEKLRRLCAPFLTDFEHPDTIEIMCNPDGQIWIERLGEEMRLVSRLESTQVQAIVETVAGYYRREVHAGQPLLEVQWPLDDSRFAAQVPPVVAAPSITLRRRASKVFTLKDYIQASALTVEQAEILRQAIASHKNILVAGGTGSGKTTLVNGLIAEMVSIHPSERIIILEDTPEVRCSASNCVQLLTTLSVSLTDLLKSSLRMRPDRILVGEVRGPEALDLVMAWNTGHPGGMATIHSDQAETSLTRLEMLMSMHPLRPNRLPHLIAEVVDVVVSIARTPKGRGVQAILVCRGYQDGRYQLEKVG
ncbi:MAG: P-type conjugative transfer ATPase TrbB [Myxococcales bacterium]|nr:P-type conjugative transfer ATPase TrbB [Myxococcales bacterium]